MRKIRFAENQSVRNALDNRKMQARLRIFRRFDSQLRTNYNVDRIDVCLRAYPENGIAVKPEICES